MPRHPDWNLLAFVRVKRGKGSRVGTGYPVGPDLVLTASHVVESADADAISVTFAGRPREPGRPWDGRQRSAAYEATLVWDGRDEKDGDQPLDAALLRLMPSKDGSPVPSLPFAELATRHDTVDVDWVGRGFARVGKAGARKRSPVNLSGRAYAPDSGRFEVTVEAPPENPPDDWPGASGAPVFVGGRIAGILERVPKAFRARLHAVSAATLLDLPDFRQHLVAPDAGLSEVLRQAIERDLADEEIRSALEPLAEAQGEDLAKAVWSAPLVDVFAAIETALFVPERSPKAPSPALLDRFETLALNLFAARSATTELVDGIRGVQAHTITTVEGVAARHDARPAQFEDSDPARSDCFPKPRNRMPLVPDLGTDPKSWPDISTAHDRAKHCLDAQARLRDKIRPPADASDAVVKRMAEAQRKAVNPELGRYWYFEYSAAHRERWGLDAETVDSIHRLTSLAIYERREGGPLDDVDVALSLSRILISLQKFRGRGHQR
ncbi:MAG: trypsin-like peptidase domain-containing protein [Planctomycetes bacterium]|nr:trypsin-like peptidase domain-containing protein [Planctomycetota bacterium]